MNNINIQLYGGDCLAVMDELIANEIKVDAVITDPPYGMKFKSNYRKNKYNNIINDKTTKWLNEFAEKCWQISNDNTAHYIFCSFHNIDKFKQAFEKRFKIKNILVWEKNNTSMGDLKANFAPKIEFILFMQKGRKFINGKRDPNIFKFKRTNNNLHPTQKPLDLMEYLITKFTNENETVIDPFMGSGTTGVACKNLNRNFIGIELDKKYFEIAQKRIYT